jgi:hypothetical protein
MVSFVRSVTLRQMMQKAAMTAQKQTEKKPVCVSLPCPIQWSNS